MKDQQKWYCLNRRLKKIRGLLADLLEAHIKSEHQSEFE